jgi:hypothetical protein
MKDRPAETAGLAGAVGLLIGKLAGIDDPTTLTALGIVVAAVPAAVTFAVAKVPRFRRWLGITSK